MEQKDINELMQKSPEWRQKDNCCENCERLEKRIKVLEDENTKLRNEIIFVYRRLNCNDETAKSIVLGSIEIRFPEIYRAALEVKP